MARKFTMLTAGEIRPTGWLQRQLRIQAEGLNGNLDKVWPDVRDSKWFGGEADGWERAPYWMDGFLQLAYLLDDEDLKSRVATYIDGFLKNQQENGWFFPAKMDQPIEKYDSWAQILLGKVLVEYYLISGDERIPTALYRFLKSYYELLKNETIRLFDWGKFRWYEFFITLNWAKESFPGEAWIDDLARLFRAQGADYRTFEELWKTPLNHWKLETHIVNLAMMLKSEAVSCDLLGEEYTDLAEHFHEILSKYNGTAVGLYTGDECLSGISPIQGTEFCAVVEQMYSYELLYEYTGDSKWAERLEMLAFNALPATASDDMWTHQYDQMSNQIECSRIPGRAHFGTNSADAHIFGLEPNFGCCTANFGQGWPKFARSAFYKTEQGLISAVAVPSEVHIDWKGSPVGVTLETEYPFRNSFRYTVAVKEKGDFVLEVRVPSFAKNVKVNGKAVRRRDVLSFDSFRAGETVIDVSYETLPEMSARPNRLYTAKMGSLVFAVNVESDWVMKEYTLHGVERKFPYCDYYLLPKSDWNYGYASKELRAEERAVDAVPFSSKNPPVVLYAELSHIDWGYEPRYDCVCAKVPHSRVALDAPHTLALYPYGCAKLRMTELPMIKK